MTTLETIQEIADENLDITIRYRCRRLHVRVSHGIDSLDMVELVCEIENRFRHRARRSRGLDTVGKLVDYIDGLK